MLSTDTILQQRYRIVRQLGQGGMGAVYEAVDERLDTVVALKETLFTDEKLRKQFEREARLLARMHHPALPRVSDHFNEGDRSEERRVGKECRSGWSQDSEKEKEQERGRGSRDEG